MRWKTNLWYERLRAGLVFGLSDTTLCRAVRVHISSGRGTMTLQRSHKGAKFRKNSKSFMLPTDGKPTNGFENEIRWSFFESVGQFFF
jgi:hypothetical protein